MIKAVGKEPLLPKYRVLVLCDFCHKVLQTEWFKTRLLSHSSGGQTSEIDLIGLNIKGCVPSGGSRCKSLPFPVPRGVLLSLAQGRFSSIFKVNPSLSFCQRLSASDPPASLSEAPGSYTDPAPIIQENPTSQDPQVHHICIIPLFHIRQHIQ